MIIIKIGGVVATDTSVLTALLTELAPLRNSAPVLVHGGGKEVTAFGEKLGLTAVFQNGIRLTSPAEMEVVDMVLGGKINIDLVRRAGAVGIPAVGLGGQDGSLFVGRPRTDLGGSDSRTGELTETNPRILEVLTGAGYLPIVNSTSRDAQGRGLNINADEAAQAVAIAARAEALVFISDIAGVLKNGQVIGRLDEAAIATEIAAGVISGGMVPKVRSALQAVQTGVGRVVIGGYQTAGDLAKLLAGTAGTTIH